MSEHYSSLRESFTKSAKSPFKKTSGSKHLELQKALKAQADKRAAERRMGATTTASNLKDYSERVD